MAGFDNDICYANNVDFSGGSPVSGKVVSDGQLLIGSTASPNIRVGTLSSSDSSITWSVGAGTISGVVAGGTTVGKTITGDSGGSLAPTAGNWNILGGPGVTTSGSGSTLTINSVPFTDITAQTLVVDNGYFATAAGTYPMPATAAQGEIIIVICDTSGVVVLDCPALNFIRIGNTITSSGGTISSTAQGDSVTLRYRASTLTWEATSSTGSWSFA